MADQYFTDDVPMLNVDLSAEAEDLVEDRKEVRKKRGSIARTSIRDGDGGRAKNCIAAIPKNRMIWSLFPFSLCVILLEGDNVGRGAKRHRTRTMIALAV